MKNAPYHYAFNVTLTKQQKGKREKIMQCKHMNEIWSVDKKFIKQNGLINTKQGRQITKEILKAGEGFWEYGVDVYFKDKKWVYFNSKPFKGKAKWLLDAGYYKYNKVGCGTCEICRTQRSKTWAVKATCEYKCWEKATFLTLTYNNQNLEVNNGYINKADMVKFWKDLRYHLYKNVKKAKKIDLSEEYENMREIPEKIKLKYMTASRKPANKPLRYIQCNEYGERKGRPHAHAVAFNFEVNDIRIHSRDRRGYYIYTSKKLNKLWGHGYVIVGRVNANVSAYVARYNTKKFSNTSGIVNETIYKLNFAYKNCQNDEGKQIIKNHLQIWKERRECISASSLGYIGSYYWETNKEKIMRDGGIFVNWAKGVNLESIPKPMEKQYESEYPIEYDWYEYNKTKTAKEQWEIILSKTSLSEQEYIEDTYRQRMKKLKKLKREYDEKPINQSIYANA